MTPKCVTFLRCFNHTQFELTDGGRRKSDFSIIGFVVFRKRCAYIQYAAAQVQTERSPTPLSISKGSSCKVSPYPSCC